MADHQISNLQLAFMLSLYLNLNALLDFINGRIDEFHSHQYLQHMNMTPKNRLLILKTVVAVLLSGVCIYVGLLMIRMPSDSQQRAPVISLTPAQFSHTPTTSRARPGT